ncbi:uncharacterized protein K452DRAFT_283007 [Aplosporella prunicola CBS 121167]|uniref:Uncharacterized protein n=1 Tax=Aplosporella prunicola CBS 121167 TaxID=1176127 RepID=A0A6A6BU59_9PEZI|nr:uncharacterized protein K452DRAFT_283007 [Aplosporella prunicola CBS 121167]KAF2146805.1 hypothetical protein K452DRAFT_283007 [Aplosporella prunicola CBS 121167]
MTRADGESAGYEYSTVFLFYFVFLFRAAPGGGSSDGLNSRIDARLGTHARTHTHEQGRRD